MFVKKETVRDIFIVIFIAIFVRLLPTLLHGAPIGDDTWSWIALMRGRIGYSYPMGTFDIYASATFSDYPKTYQYYQPYFLLQRYIITFLVHIYGLFWQLADKMIVFNDLIPTVINVFMSLSFYNFTKFITRNNRLSLLSILFYNFTINQSIISFGQWAENLALAFMLLSLTSYLCFTEKRGVKYILLCFLFGAATLFTHIMPFIILCTLLVAFSIIRFVYIPLNKKNYVVDIVLVAVFAIISYLLLFTFLSPEGRQVGSAPSTLGNVVAYYVPLNYNGVFICSLSVIGVFFTGKTIKNTYFRLLVGWAFIGFIFSYQYAFGIPILYPANRLFLEFTIPLSILASVSVHNIKFKKMPPFKFREFLISEKQIGVIFEFVKVLLVTFTLLSTSFSYLTAGSGLDPVLLVNADARLSNEEYQAIAWLTSNIDANNVIVLSDPDYSGYISLLSDFKVIRNAFGNVIDPRETLALDEDFLDELLVVTPFSSIVICQLYRNMPRVSLPSENIIYENEAVRLFLIDIIRGIGPTFHVMVNGTLTNVNSSYAAFGSKAIFTLSLANYTQYYVAGIPDFLSYEQIIPEPSSIKIDANEYINVIGENNVTYRVSFLGSSTFSKVLWKDDSFAKEWKLNAGSGLNRTDGDIYNMTKQFTEGLLDEMYSVYRTINVSGAKYFHFRLKGIPGGHAQVAVYLLSQSGDWEPIIELMESPSSWTTYQIELNPNKTYEAVVLRLMDTYKDVSGTHSIQWDYIMFVK